MLVVVTASDAAPFKIGKAVMAAWYAARLMISLGWGMLGFACDRKPLCFGEHRP
jgi:hypothetical protein